MLTSAATTAKASENATIPRSPRSRRRCVASSGTSASGANFARPASAASTPRPGGEPAASSAPRTSAATSASLVLHSSAKAVNGKLTQA